MTSELAAKLEELEKQLQGWRRELANKLPPADVRRFDAMVSEFTELKDLVVRSAGK
ncbi:MAG: hypothetical protein K8T25_01940 [Planctomycetia bacterium]|nr:hypothetical protein [Planctomycetia bacterium]